MKILTRSIAILLLFAGFLHADDNDPKWLTDFETAKYKAAEQDRPILVDFTGSDWCGWCIRLKEEVFTQDAFKTFAKENLVLFEADFPMNTPQADELRQQNQALQRQFKIRGFPTILLLNAEERELGRTGYLPGGPEAYVEHLRELLEKSRFAKTPATP